MFWIDGATSLPHLTNANAVFQNPARRRSDMHQAGLVDEFAIEVRRTGEAMPGFDAEERRAAGFRPQPELRKTLPGHFYRWTACGGVTESGARNPIQNDRIVLKKLF